MRITFVCLLSGLLLMLFLFENAIALFASENIHSKDLVIWRQIDHLLNRRLLNEIIN